MPFESFIYLRGFRADKDLVIVNKMDTKIISTSAAPHALVTASGYGWATLSKMNVGKAEIGSEIGLVTV